MDFDSFYTENAAMVRKIVASKLHARYKDDIDDCCQLVWLKVSKAMRTDKWAAIQSDRPSHWLAKVSRTTALDHRKALAKRPEISMDAMSESSLHLEDVEVPDSIYDVLTAGVDQLPPRTQLVTKAFYWFSLSIAEIANLLNLAEGTIKWHLHRGRKLIERYITSEGKK